MSIKVCLEKNEKHYHQRRERGTPDDTYILALIYTVVKVDGQLGRFYFYARICAHMLSKEEIGVDILLLL